MPWIEYIRSPFLFYLSLHRSRVIIWHDFLLLTMMTVLRLSRSAPQKRRCGHSLIYPWCTLELSSRCVTDRHPFMFCVKIKSCTAIMWRVMMFIYVKDLESPNTKFEATLEVLNDMLPLEPTFTWVKQNRRRWSITSDMQVLLLYFRISCELYHFGVSYERVDSRYLYLKELDRHLLFHTFILTVTDTLHHVQPWKNRR